MKSTNSIISKKNQQPKSNNYHGNMELPEVINMDALSYANDDELERRLSFLQGEISKAAKVDYDLQPWEVEVCYVQRELRIRTARRSAHDRYMRNNPETYQENTVNFE